jgi:hypothetical protein
MSRWRDPSKPELDIARVDNLASAVEAIRCRIQTVTHEGTHPVYNHTVIAVSRYASAETGEVEL